MKPVICVCLLVILASRQIFAQDFVGYVKNSAEISQAIYHASVKIIQEDKVVDSLKTLANGSFRFTPEKNQTYIIHVSQPGYEDTAFTIISDKNGTPDPTEITIKLKRDGLHLVGQVKSAGDNFRIKGAAIILRNVMTGKTERIISGTDGAYSLKLDYETIYEVSIDKYSPGIINKYQDTSFHVSTIGFNQPLDYYMDIALGPATSTVHAPEDYDAEAEPDNSQLKPVVTVRPSKKQPGSSINSARDEHSRIMDESNSNLRHTVDGSVKQPGSTKNASPDSIPQVKPLNAHPTVDPPAPKAD